LTTMDCLAVCSSSPLLSPPLSAKSFDFFDIFFSKVLVSVFPLLHCKQYYFTVKNIDHSRSGLVRSQIGQSVITSQLLLCKLHSNNLSERERGVHMYGAHVVKYAVFSVKRCARSLV
jgi:hypothetical protein